MIASVVFAVIGLLVLHASFQEYRSTQEADKYAKLHGCKEPVKEDPYDFLGIKKVYTSTRALLNKRALENAINAFEKHGETFGSRILAQRVFFTCSPRNIKHVLVSRFVDFEASSVRAHLFRPITEKGIFAVDGQEWKHARDLYRGLFTNTRSVTNIPKLESRFQTLLKYLPEGEAVDMQKLFLKLTLDMTSEFAIGESLDTLSPDTQSQEKKDLVKSLLYVDKILARDGFLGPAAAFLSKKEFHKCCGDVHRFVEKRIYAGLEKRRALKAKSEDLPEAFNILEGLMVNTEEMLELRDSATTILIAGVEGITSLIGTVFYLLSRNPRVQDKLRSIILETIGHEVPTFDQLQNLAYLRFVLNETMRVYPPVPFNARTANKNTTLPYGGGADGESPVMIRKGQRVVFSSWATHRSKSNFGEDAHEYIPERWEDLTADSLMGYFPFNSGPRACPGQKIALMQASFVTVRLLQNFSSIKPGDDKPWVEHFGLNLSNDNGCVVEVTKDLNNPLSV